MSLIDKFIAEFKPKLTATEYKQHQFNRWPAFEFIARELLAARCPIIIETGTLNTTEDWLGYGQSALLWNWIAKHKVESLVFSIDIDEQKCSIARKLCPHSTIECSDSVIYLRQCAPVTLKHTNLLYLDSYNWSPIEHLSSSIHHLAELTACYDKLPSGCLIAVDDCHSDTQGKHVMVRDFLKYSIGVEPIVKCHINVWRKP